MNKVNFCCWMAVCFVFVSLAAIISCNDVSKKIYHKNQSHADINDESISTGAILAAKYCQSCHMLPSPDLLNSNSWATGVLPQMAPRLGIFEHLYEKYPNNIQDPSIGRNFYPLQPAMTDQEWQNIIDYYTATSPDSLPSQQRQSPIEKNLTLFKAIVPTKQYDTATTSMVKIDTAAHELYIADVLRHSIRRYNKSLQPIDSIVAGGSIVDIIFSQGGLTACNAGVFTPANGKFGSVQHFFINKSRLALDKEPVFDQLIRPVSLATADLNGDGRPDYVVCEFGYLKGMLSWEENLGNGKYEHHILREVPGATNVCINDYNHDGLPDVWALFAQGDEGIFLYVNKGDGRFEEKRLLSFLPSYGSTHFELADFNKDGYPDIIYTCGDNGDFSTVLKPYHGIYIFLNDGKNGFNQKYFFPMNGCYKAIARDFDNDGDLDIAAIAFFADFKNQPDEGFVYLENKGDMNFSPYTIEEGKSGRWISMDAADVDGDGMTDIVLGNCSIGPTIMHATTDWKKGPAFILLKNLGK